MSEQELQIPDNVEVIISFPGMPQQEVQNLLKPLELGSKPIKYIAMSFKLRVIAQTSKVIILEATEK